MRSHDDEGADILHRAVQSAGWVPKSADVLLAAM